MSAAGVASVAAAGEASVTTARVTTADGETAVTTARVTTVTTAGVTTVSAAGVARVAAGVAFLSLVVLSDLDGLLDVVEFDADDPLLGHAVDGGGDSVVAGDSVSVAVAG